MAFDIYKYFSKLDQFNTVHLLVSLLYLIDFFHLERV
jgi:hypothetical protein